MYDLSHFERDRYFNAGSRCMFFASDIVTTSVWSFGTAKMIAWNSCNVHIDDDYEDVAADARQLLILSNIPE